MQSLLYPTKKISISQNYNGKYSHYENSHGKPFDYPIDETCGNSSRDWFYAPCDCIIRRIYGVGNKGTNTIWIESTDKVKLANGTSSYVTIMIIHPNDDTLKKIKVGQIFKQGTKMFKEGNDGNATGYHFHISVSTNRFNKLKNNGWVLNNRKGWVISSGSIKPENAFYIDTGSTKIINTNGLKFKLYEKEKTYIVKKGDTLSSIANKFKTTWKSIYNKNKKIIGNNPNIIHPGQKLVI